MGDPENTEIESEEQIEEQPAAAAGGGSRFSIPKIIEWLLSNLIVLILAVVLSTVIAWILVRTNVSKKSDETYQTVQLGQKPPPLTVFSMEEFKINTSDIDEPHFIRIKLSIGYNDAKYKGLQTELVDRRAQIRDIILQILSAKRKEDIDQELEKQRLKEEILKSVNIILNNGQIEAVYYDEFVIS